MDLYTKENGLMIFKMVMVKKNLKMELCIEEILWMERNKAKEFKLGQMDQVMKENTLIIKFMDWDNINGLMEGNIKVIGFKEK